MNTKSLVLCCAITAIVIVTSYGFTTYQKEKEPWPVPDKDAKMANPMKGDAASVSTGNHSGLNTVNRAMEKPER
jgi:hypothetical protein